MSLHRTRSCSRRSSPRRATRGLADRKYTFKVHQDAHKTQVRQAVEQLFERQGPERPHDQGAARSRSAAASPRASARAGRRPSCSCARATRSRSSKGPRSDGSQVYGDQEVQAHEPGASLHGDLVVRGGHQEGRPRSRCSSRSRRRAAGTTTAASRRVTRAAATSASTASSTSSASRTACRRRSPRSSTTRTGRRGSRCSTTSTAPRRTSSRPQGLRVGASVESGPGCRHQGGQRAPAREHPDGNARPQRRAQARPGRQDGALGRRGRPARRQGRRLRRAAPPVRRDAARPADLPRHRRPGRQLRSRATSRAARRAAAAGSASARPCAARR